MESSKVVKEEAGRWLIRRDSGKWSDSDERALNEWLDASTAHRVAYLRLEAAWKQAGRLKSLAADVPPKTVPSPDHWRDSPFFRDRERLSPPRRRRMVWAIGFATVAVTVALAVGVTLWQFSTRAPTYQTPIGGTASVPMEDGSKVTLNTSSEIRVSVSNKARIVTLERGEAFFQVAPDPSRPFTVRAGSQRVVAIGTAFSVRLKPEGVSVVVTEGRVRLEQDDAPGDAKPVVLAAGSVANARNDSVDVRTAGEAATQDSLAWRSGFLVFQDTRLDEAVAEFNRYNAHKIILGDPSIGAIRLTGKFESTKYDAFVRLLGDAFSVDAQRDADQIVLSRR